MKQLLIIVSIALMVVGSSVSPVVAAEEVRIFPLQYRSASEALRRVEPLLLEGERASAAERHLVVIASPNTLEAVEKIVSVIDRQQRQFLIQIRWVDAVAVSRGRLGYDARSGMSTMSAKGRTLGTSQRQSGQQMRVTEGVGAVVVTGQDIPYNSSWAVWSGDDGDGFASTVSFQKIRSGFSILINSASDDMLQVKITPQLMEAGQGTMLKPATLRLDRLTTEIRIKPGEWIDLAAFLPDSGIGTQILAGSDEPLPSGRSLQLRIDE